ncbi:hypothetical protein N7530_006418 [Penicillium desertorum]|uniref:Uncharacterized protein n=1 Tax=Penicillium desertorum TaxID=1303715 RepID=A0A9X0BMK9_9EURO|nr:hypothetical protein N7530_006418 [Penicillium desertorum]
MGQLLWSFCSTRSNDQAWHGISSTNLTVVRSQLSLVDNSLVKGRLIGERRFIGIECTESSIQKKC